MIYFRGNKNPCDSTSVYIVIKLTIRCFTPAISLSTLGLTSSIINRIALKNLKRWSS